MSEITVDAKEYEDMQRDAERWRKLQALLQQAYDGGRVEINEPTFSVDCGMVYGRHNYRFNEATLHWGDVRDEPLDLGGVLDQVIVDHG